uniref:Uncharacterized protein n=1 Tax=Microbotryum lychnidis-dioicae TaxID=288795 RepID=M1GMF0_9BASI|nr:hypothetical protein H911_mgp33 [Microbotryum lychnidis-dioicae]AGE14584.1 hypothetical protein [Microbotryum lychnidis-dioicae]
MQQPFFDFIKKGQVSLDLLIENWVNWQEKLTPFFSVFSLFCRPGALVALFFCKKCKKIKAETKKKIKKKRVGPDYLSGFIQIKACKSTCSEVLYDGTIKFSSRFLPAPFRYPWFF